MLDQNRSRLILLRIDATDYCNQNCIHCSFSRRYSNNTNYLSFEKLKNLLTTDLSDVVKGNKVRILITGGEPLLHPKLNDLIGCLRSINCAGTYISLATNGLLLGNLTERYGICAASINELIISTETNEKEYLHLRGINAYNQVRETCAWFMENNKKQLTMMNVLIYKNNMKDLDKIIKDIDAFPSHGARLITYNAEKNIPNYNGLECLSKDDTALVRQILRERFDRIRKGENKKKIYFVDRTEPVPQHINIQITCDGKISYSNSNLSI